MTFSGRPYLTRASSVSASIKSATPLSKACLSRSSTVSLRQATPEEVRLEACDPGSQAGVGRDKSMEALTLVGVRSAIGSGMLDLGVPVSTARCIAQAMVARYSVDQLSSSTEWADDPALQSGVVEIFRTCGYGGPA